MIYTIQKANMAELGLLVQPGKTGWKSLAALRNQLGADCAVNAQMWNWSTGATSYALKVSGTVYGADEGAWIWGYGWNAGEAALHWASADHMREYANYIGCERIVDGGAVCIAEHTAKAYAGRTGRTALGVTGSGDIVLFADAAALTVQELAERMLSAGCATAIMLDGGGSTQLITPTGAVSSARAVQSIFYVCLASCPYQEPTGTVAQGSYGEGAKWVQWQLNRRRDSKLAVDGVFGAASVAALKEFQTGAGLTADGVCGAATREALAGRGLARPIRGIDCATPLTAVTAKALYDAGQRFAGRYMVPESYGYKALKKDEAQAIHQAGLAILPCWETTGRRSLGGAAYGTEDGRRALERALYLGIPEGTVLYFAECDFDVPASSYDAVEAYILAAAFALGGRYRAGLYGSFSVVEEMHRRGACGHFWQCVAWSGGKISDAALTYQSAGNQSLAGISVDYNQCADLDKAGFWRPGTAAESPAQEMTLEQRVAALEQRVAALELKTK